MQPLRELLDRITWDAGFGKGTFALGYYDRIAHQDRLVTLTSIALDPGGRTFSAHDDDGVTVHIPLHRVRSVYKDGVAIWRRQPERSSTR